MRHHSYIHEVLTLLKRRGVSGETGLGSLFGVISRVLDPQRSESGGLFVGDLLLNVFRKAIEHIVPVLPGLLKALVYRLATAVTATFSQALLLPIAYLMHSHVDVVLELLESIETDGRSGAQIVLGAWSDLAETLQGFWNIRIR